MIKRRLFLYFLTIWTILTFRSFSVSEAREDTAHLNLRKTATDAESTERYVVREGDSIDKIAQKYIGKSSRRYLVIQKLNPKLKDLNRIYPGQTLILPARGEQEKEAVPPSSTDDEETFPYRVKRGDSLTRILESQLHVRKSDFPKTLKRVKQMNPKLSDLNRIRIGQMILLPSTAPLSSSPDVSPPDNQENTPSKSMTGLKPFLPPEKEMRLLQQLISRSHGTLISKGSYFIPLPQMGRMTLDCSAIPVVEFDDGTTVLLDFSNRIPESLQRLIETNWKNYRIVKVRPSGNVLLMFQSVINASASYAANPCFKAVLLEKEPQVLIAFDWLVTRKNSGMNKPRFHGIVLASDNSQLLPGRFRYFAESRGFQLTQILNGEVSNDSPAVQNSPVLEPPTLSSENPMDFVFDVLLKLGYSPLKDQELELFDKTGDGFHLSTKADILLRIHDREILIFSERLSKQFVDILSRHNREVLIIDGRTSKKEALSQILSTVHASFSSGRYVFTLAEKGDKAKSTLTLPAIRIDRKNGPLYLIDFDLDRHLYTLLHEHWKVEILKY